MDHGCVANDIFAELMERRLYPITGKKNFGDRFVPHGNVELLYKHCGLDKVALEKDIMEVLAVEK